MYAHEAVPQWTSDVVEGVMKKLTGLQKPFKYIGERSLSANLRSIDRALLWPSPAAAAC